MYLSPMRHYHPSTLSREVLAIFADNRFVGYFSWFECLRFVRMYRGRTNRPLAASKCSWIDISSAVATPSGRNTQSHPTCSNAWRKRRRSRKIRHHFCAVNRFWCPAPIDKSHRCPTVCSTPSYPLKCNGCLPHRIAPLGNQPIRIGSQSTTGSESVWIFGWWTSASAVLLCDANSLFSNLSTDGRSADRCWRSLHRSDRRNNWNRELLFVSPVPDRGSNTKALRRFRATQWTIHPRICGTIYAAWCARARCWRLGDSVSQTLVFRCRISQRSVCRNAPFARNNRIKLTPQMHRSAANTHSCRKCPQFSFETTFCARRVGPQIIR